MSYNLTINQFEDLNLFANRNMEKVIAEMVNKSSNAALVNMGEDALILLDHNEGQFYIADYEFDRENLRLSIENFEPVELTRNEDNFEDAVYEYFENDEGDVTSLTESYKNDVIGQDKFINELVTESLSKKNFDEVVNYDAIKEAVDLVNEDFESIGESFYNKYKERLETHPLTEIKRFDWENPVTVSLVETESKKLLNRGEKKKANDLWKKEDFKEDFLDAAATFVEDVEEGTEKIKAVFENYPNIFLLDVADRQAMLGKALLASNDLREDMNDILQGINILFEKFDLKEMAEEYLFEADEDEDEEDADEEEADAEDEDEDEDEDDEEEEPEEGEEDEKEAMIADLRKVSQELEDETAKRELDNLISKYEETKNEGTRPDIVKEAVAILSL